MKQKTTLSWAGPWFSVLTLTLGSIACGDGGGPTDAQATGGGSGATNTGGAGPGGGTGGSSPGGTGGTDSTTGGAAPGGGSGGTVPTSGGTSGAGGAIPGGGGTSSGGSNPTGGSAGAGGQLPTGGSGGGGGSPPERPELVTSGPNAYWVEGTLAAASGAATVTIDEATIHQTWKGFGGTFNEQGWDALLELTEADRLTAIRLLFSATEGANFAWGRIPMGASDYALDRYTLNESAGDFEMTNFSIERDKMMLIPYIHAALAVKPDITFWGSPWTPPTWMKSSGTFDGTDDWNGTKTFEAQMLDDDATLAAYALYFARFVEEYAKEGIKISHVEPQNEPGYATRYPSCLWAPGLLGKFVGDYLGPTLEARNLDTEIWFGTLSNDATYASHINGLTGAAAGYVTGVGLQWNTIANVGTLVGQGYLVLQTEHKCGNFHWEDGFNPDQPPNDHTYGVDSWGWIKEWLVAGVHAYSAWNMVLDVQGKSLDAQRPWPQNALLVVDRGQKTLKPTAAYYVFRHLSYFVDPGAVRIGTAGGDALAFKNPDGSVVAVLHNGGAQAANTAVAIGGSTVQVPIPSQGWATIHIKG